MAKTANAEQLDFLFRAEVRDDRDEPFGHLACSGSWIVAGDVSAKTNAVIREQLAQTQPQQDTDKVLDTMAALILGSPEFQMR